MLKMTQFWFKAAQEPREVFGEADFFFFFNPHLLAEEGGRSSHSPKVTQLEIWDEEMQAQVSRTLSPHLGRQAHSCTALTLPCVPAPRMRCTSRQMPACAKPGCPTPWNRKASGSKHGRSAHQPKRKTPLKQQSNTEVYKTPGKLKLGLQSFCSLATHSHLFSTTFSKLRQLPFKKQQQKVLWRGFKCPREMEKERRGERGRGRERE